MQALRVKERPVLVSGWPQSLLFACQACRAIQFVKELKFSLGFWLWALLALTPCDPVARVLNLGKQQQR